MQIDQHILIRYFLKQASEEEKEVIRQWIESSEDNRRRFIRERIRFDASILVDEAAVEPSTKIASGKRYRLHPALNWSLKVAASILILLGSFYLYDNYRMARLAQTLQCVYVPAGNRTNIQLPDGTSVWLNANTSLRYPMAFAENSREIMLDGEAYFEVTKQSDGTPFVVKTDQYSVLVKGTKFNVSSYPEDISAKTTLLEGSIDILYKGRHIPVAPGELLSLDKQNGSFSRQRVQASQYKSWTEGRVEYDKITLNELAVRLSRKYDVQIHLGDDLEKDIAFRVSLRNEETVGDVFQALSEIIPIRYERRGRDIYIRKQ